ncbi:MAG: hypothetical protein QGH94_02700 [Phycisphaerae bacterium]|nr:hypothetical protein [Phycisphaerae bacterium]MDP7286884.1 hypothetical protein [Phycisphaerae bacterium]
MRTLYGNFDTKLDITKRRIAIAAGIREQISAKDRGNFVLVPDPEPQDGCECYLWLFPERYFRRLTASINRAELSPQEQAGLDHWLVIAQVVKPNDQGRIVIPERLMKHAVVAEELKLSCNGTHVEIWPRDKWEARFNTPVSLSRRVVDVAAGNLAAKDIDEDE